MTTATAYREIPFFGRLVGTPPTPRVRTLLGALLLWFACSAAAVTQPSKGFTTYAEADAFVQTYYQHPRPELIEGLIATAPLAALFAQSPNSQPGFVGFFSEIFSANPDRLPLWQEIAAEQDRAMKAVVEKAIALSKSGGVMARNTHSAADNDMDWGAFYASGRAGLVVKIVGELRLVDSMDIQLYWVGATAKWSLASNSHTHPRVREILEAAKLTFDKRTQEVLADLLQKDPARVMQEVKDVAAQRLGKR